MEDLFITPFVTGNGYGCTSLIDGKQFICLTDDTTNRAMRAQVKHVCKAHVIDLIESQKPVMGVNATLNQRSSYWKAINGTLTPDATYVS